MNDEKLTEKFKYLKLIFSASDDYEIFFYYVKAKCLTIPGYNQLEDFKKQLKEWGGNNTDILSLIEIKEMLENLE